MMMIRPINVTSGGESPPPSPVYSFSRLSSLEQCRLQYYYNYIAPPEERPPKVENAFAVYGSFCHELLEQYANGELAEYELLEQYTENFEEKVNIEFPPNAFVDLHDSYYNGGYSYFESFDGFDYLGGTKVLGAEEAFVEDFGDFKLRGFIDLILEDANGNIIIVDHKSKKELRTKKEREHYTLQPLLYAKHIKTKYGKWPTKLVFNMFRSGTIVTSLFTEEKYEQAVEWARKQIAFEQTITDWIPHYNYNEKKSMLFFCEALCDYRDSCQHKYQYYNEDGEQLEIESSSP